MTLNTQFLTMVSMIVGGVYLGIVLETFRRISVIWRKYPVWSYILEVVFWVSQTIFLYYILFRVNYGELRIYVFLACILGFSIYQAIFKAYYKQLLEMIIRTIIFGKNLVSKIVHMLIISPLKWVSIFIIKLFMLCLNIISSIILFILKIVYFPLKWLLRPLYRLLPKKITDLFNKLPSFYSTIKETLKKWLQYFNKRR